MQWPPRPGPGIEGLEPEGLGGGRVDDFLDVDAHAQREQLELVDQSDVHAAVDVFEQLGHFGSRGRRNRDHTVEDGAVKCARQLRCLRVESADDFRDIVARDSFVAGVFALGRKGNEERFRIRGAGARAFRPCLFPFSRIGTRTSSVVPG